MGLDLTTTAVYAALLLAVAGVELRGLANRRKGDTVTENWRWADRWLRAHAPAAGWVFRVATIGFLTWTVLHFATGSS